MMSDTLDDFAAHTATRIAELDSSDLLDGINFTVEQQVTDGVTLVGNYHLTLADGAATVHAGPAANPDITIRQDAQTAIALRDGLLHAQGAFLTGRLTIDGDIAKLLEHGPILAKLLSGVRE